MIIICLSINLLGTCLPGSSIDDDPTKTLKFKPVYKYNKWNSNCVS